jgi:hypothetical protein
MRALAFLNPLNTALRASSFLTEERVLFGTEVSAAEQTHKAGKSPYRYWISVQFYFQPTAAIFRLRKAIWVASGKFFGHTSWQPRSDMQPNTPLSSPINS